MNGDQILSRRFQSLASVGISYVFLTRPFLIVWCALAVWHHTRTDCSGLYTLPSWRDYLLFERHLNRKLKVSLLFSQR